MKRAKFMNNIRAKAGRIEGISYPIWFFILIVLQKQRLIGDISSEQCIELNTKTQWVSMNGANQESIIILRQLAHSAVLCNNTHYVKQWL